MSATTIDIGPHLLFLAILWSVYGFLRLARNTHRDRDGRCPSAPASRPAASRAGRPTSAPESVAMPKRDPILEVCRIVGGRYGVTVDELLSPTRTKPIALARQVAMRLLRELTDLSYPQIAARFDRNHSTVIHAVRATDGMLLEDLREEASAALAQPPGGPLAQDAGGHDRQRVQPVRQRAVLPRRRQAHAREAPISPTDERTIS